MDFKTRIRQLRIERKLTQKQLADNTSLTETALQNYEYGARKPAFDILIALEDYFDVSLDYLVGRSDDPKRR